MFFCLPNGKFSAMLLCTLKCFMNIVHLYNNGAESEEKGYRVFIFKK
jgi:hypothetical protein